MNTTYRTMVDFAPGAQPYQFVPTSLGNECARPLFTAGREFINFGQGVSSGLKAKLSVFGFTIPVNIPITELKYDCAVYASSIPETNATNRKIAELKTVFKFMLFGFIQIAKSGYDKKADAPNTYLAVDGVPGSINTILDLSELRNYANGVGNWYWKPEDRLLFYISYKEVVKLKFYAFAKAFQYNSGVFTTQYTAMPVGSALDVAPFNSSTFTQKYVNGININFPSKGTTFIAQETNTTQSLFNNASMRFTARNARFMFKEMEQLPNTENCSAECGSTFVLAGSDQICTAENFSIPGLPGGVSVAWNVTPTGIVTPSGTGNSVTLTRNPNANGLITLTATFSICGISQTFSKTIHAGTPNLSQLSISGVTDNQFVCPNVPISVGIGYLTTPYRCGVAAGGITNAQWEVTTPSSSATINYNTGMAACEATNNNAGVTITFPNLGYTYTANVRVRAFNSCGWSNWFPAPMLRLQVKPNGTNCGGGGFENRIVVSPNPSTGATTIEASENFSFTQIRVFDKFGAVRKQFNFPKGSKKVTINIGELPTDIYEIQAFDGKEWKSVSFSKQ